MVTVLKTRKGSFVKHHNLFKSVHNNLLGNNMSQVDQDINGGFKIFAEAVKIVLEKDICKDSMQAKQDHSSGDVFQSLKELNEIIEYLNFMLNGGEFPKKLEDLIKYIKGISTNEQVDKSDTYLEFLESLADEYKERFGCNFTEQNFKDLFDEMKKSIQAEDRESVIAVPLTNFELIGDKEEVTIGQFKIRKQSTWGNRKKVLFLMDPWLLGITTKGLWTDLRGSLPHELPPNMVEFIKVARLFKKGYVSTSNLLLAYPKVPKIFSRIIDPLMAIGIRSPFDRSMSKTNTKYSLNDKELDGLRKLWKLYNSAKSQLPEELRRALEWFNKSYEESEIENKILDLAIAFETMFGGRKYIILAPRLISDNYDERKKITKGLEQLMKKRSSIVHKGHGGKRHELENIAMYAEEIFRKSYIKFLGLINENKSKKYKDIIDEILFG